MATVKTTTDPKPGVKSTEFWAAIGIGDFHFLKVLVGSRTGPSQRAEKSPCGVSQVQ